MKKSDWMIEDEIHRLNTNWKMTAWVGGLIVVVPFVFMVGLMIMPLARSGMMRSLQLFAMDYAEFAELYLYVTLIPVMLFSLHQRRKLKTFLSYNVVQHQLEEAFDTLIKYKPAEGIPEYLVYATGFTDAVKYNCSNPKAMAHGNDYLQATYRGVSFQFSDVTLTTGFGRGEHAFFKGQWLVINMETSISPSVTISQLSNLGGFSSLLARDSLVEMENVAFNKAFKVSTSDPHQAFYVLTPQMMEFLLSGKGMPVGNKHICLTQKQLHLAINTNRDSFEPCHRVGDLAKLRKQIDEEINFIKGVIDQLLKQDNLFTPKQKKVKEVPEPRKSSTREYGQIYTRPT